MTKDEALKLALEALESSDELINGSEEAINCGYSVSFDFEGNNKLLNKAINAIKEALTQTEEHMKLEWTQAPVKTQWGNEMVVASLAIDKDHTVCLYCERDQTAKVDAMFAQRTWVGLTNKDVGQILKRGDVAELDAEKGLWHVLPYSFAQAIEAKLKEKNNG